MPPTNWQDLASAVKDPSRPSATGDSPGPSQAEDNANAPNHNKTRRDKFPGGWRRSERVRIEMPVDVCVCEEDVEPVFTRVKTLDVSAHGALLDLKMPVDIGQTLRLVNIHTEGEIECHVLRFARRYPEGGGHVGVEFAGVSRHFWDLPSPPADWDPDWVPSALPERPPPKLPRTEKSSREHLQAPAIVRNVQVKSRVPKRPMIALVASVLLFTAWIVMRSPDAADSSSRNGQPTGMAPEDASRIPRVERTRLATAEDFDADAISWLSGSGQQVSGKIPGFYAGSKKSNAYILVGKANERRVVILAGGELHYNAEFPGVAVAACVPMELVHKIKWADPAVPESDGDGLLIVRSADAPASGVVLFLRGSQVVSASPTDYREVAFGQGCQP